MLVELDGATEAIYKRAEIDDMVKELVELRKTNKQLTEANNDLKTERRLLYLDVKKIHTVLPMENGSISMVRLPRVVNELTKNPKLVEGFKGITGFVERFEKNNLTVLK